MSIKHFELDDTGTIAGTSLTTSFANLISMTDDATVLFFFNSTDVSVILSIPSYIMKTKSYTTKQWRIPAGGSFALDGRTNSGSIAKGTIQVKSVTGAGTSGEVTINICR